MGPGPEVSFLSGSGGSGRALAVREAAGREGKRPARRKEPRRRHHDGGQEQQDAAAHRLPHEVHPAGRARLHRHLQGLRQAHEPHPLRLRRVPQDQAQELQAARAGGEARAGPGAAPWREPGLHDGGGAAPQGHWDCPCATGWGSRRTRCRQSCWKRSPSRGSHAPSACGFGRSCAWSWWTITTGNDASESRDGCCRRCCCHS